MHLLSSQRQQKATRPLLKFQSFGVFGVRVSALFYIYEVCENHSNALNPELYNRRTEFIDLRKLRFLHQRCADD